MITVKGKMACDDCGTMFEIDLIYNNGGNWADDPLDEESKRLGWTFTARLIKEPDRFIEEIKHRCPGCSKQQNIKETQGEETK